MSTPSKQIETKTRSESRLLALSTDLLKLQSSFLDVDSLIRQSKTCTQLRKTSKEVMDRAKARELLDLVLNIGAHTTNRIFRMLQSPTGLRMLRFSTVGQESIILMPSDGTVKYFSWKTRETITRAQFKNITPLQGAVLTGNFYLVRYFMACLSGYKQNTSALQLSEARNSSDFLAPFFDLQKAYQKFVKLRNELKKADVHFATRCSDENSKALDSLWKEVGESYKKLSTFGIQYFCNILPKSIDYPVELNIGCGVPAHEVNNLLDSVGGNLALYRGYRGAFESKTWRCALNVELDANRVAFVCKEISENMDKVIAKFVPIPVPKPEGISVSGRG